MRRLSSVCIGFGFVFLTACADKPNDVSQTGGGTTTTKQGGLYFQDGANQVYWVNPYTASTATKVVDSFATDFTGLSVQPDALNSSSLNPSTLYSLGAIASSGTSTSMTVISRVFKLNNAWYKINSVGDSPGVASLFSSGDLSNECPPNKPRIFWDYLNTAKTTLVYKTDARPSSETDYCNTWGGGSQQVPHTEFPHVQFSASSTTSPTSGYYAIGALHNSNGAIIDYVASVGGFISRVNLTAPAYGSITKRLQLTNSTDVSIDDGWMVAEYGGTMLLLLQLQSSPNHELYRWDSAGTTLQGPLATQAIGGFSHFRSDGVSVYYVAGGNLYGVPVSGGTPTTITSTIGTLAPEGIILSDNHVVYRLIDNSLHSVAKTDEGGTPSNLANSVTQVITAGDWIYYNTTTANRIMADGSLPDTGASGLWVGYDYSQTRTLGADFQVQHVLLNQNNTLSLYDGATNTKLRDLGSIPIAATTVDFTVPALGKFQLGRIDNDMYLINKDTAGSLTKVHTGDGTENVLF